MRIQTRIVRSFVAAALVLTGSLLTGCMEMPYAPELGFPEKSEPLSPRLAPEEAWDIAEAALQAFDEGDYEGFSAAWDEPLRAGIDADAFAAFREQTLDRAGRFQRILDYRLTSADAEGHVRYVYWCEFEKEDLFFGLVVPDDGLQVAGTWLMPVDE